MSPRTKKVLRVLVLGAVAVGVGIQFVPVRDVGTNPPHRFKLDAPPEVEAADAARLLRLPQQRNALAALRRLAPSSWLMSRDIHNGRNHLNFSEWGDVDEDERQDDLENAWEQVESGEMPPWFYILPFHPDAKLSAADKALLKSYFLKNKKSEEKPKAGGAEVAGSAAKPEREKGRVGTRSALARVAAPPRGPASRGRAPSGSAECRGAAPGRRARSARGYPAGRRRRSPR